MSRVESFPSGFLDNLKSRIGEYKLDVTTKKENFEGMDETTFIDEIYSITEMRAKATLRLMKDHPWDFFMTIFTSLDRLQHVFYGYCDKESPFYDIKKTDIFALSG